MWRRAGRCCSDCESGTETWGTKGWGSITKVLAGGGGGGGGAPLSLRVKCAWTYSGAQTQGKGVELGRLCIGHVDPNPTQAGSWVWSGGLG